MDWEAFKILTSDRIQRILEENIAMDPSMFAMTYRTNAFPAALVSTQLKYLQRARRKLPSFYVSRCLIPPLAYEQASSEATANLKPRPTGRVLDLTCGLGVDTAHFARTAQEVVALEPNPDLHRVSSYNLARLGHQNVRLLLQRAEDFVENYTGEPFEIIYVDPSRRGTQAERLHDLADGQPAIQALLPSLRRMGRRLLIKAAPGYDIQAGLRLLPDIQQVSIVSYRNECKELWFDIDLQSHSPTAPSFEIVASRQTGVHRRSLPAPQQSWDLQHPAIQPGHYLLEPDVAYYKAQRLDVWLSDTIRGQQPLGFLWSHTAPETFSGRVFVVQAVWPYQPKAVKRHLKAAGISRANITRRAFPLTVQAIRERLRLADGGEAYLLCSVWNKQKYVVLAREGSSF